jgi:hypothetical protein
VTKIKSKVNHKVKLRKTEKSDLELLFQFQLDKEANYLAAFTSKDRPTKKPILKNLQKF